MEPNTEGNLLEIIDLARTLRQEQLFIQHEQATFAQMTQTLVENSTSLTKLAYICAQQRQNLNDLILSRPEAGPVICCRRAKIYANVKFVDAKKVMDYEHAIAYEALFNQLYRSPYLLALSLAIGDRTAAITTHHMSSVIHTVSSGLYGNAINSKDVEMVLKLLRELIEIQIVASDNPRRLLRANSSSFARLYQRLNESMFSAKIFLTAALFEPLMGVLSDSDTVLDVDPDKVVETFSTKERMRRFGDESSEDYRQNIEKFHEEIMTKLHLMASAFIDSLIRNWSLFPSTLRWLVQTMCHHLKQAHFGDKIINEILNDMVFTHFICPAIVSPDIVGIIDAPISESVRFNLIQIGQIIQMLALTRHTDEIDTKFAAVHARFSANLVTQLIDMLLVSQSGEDVVAILAQQSDFERSHLLSTQHELAYFVEFFRILSTSDEYDVALPAEERDKLQKVLTHLPESATSGHYVNGGEVSGNMRSESSVKERSKQSFMGLGKVTKSKIAKSMSFSTNGANIAAENDNAVNGNVPMPSTSNGLGHVSMNGGEGLHSASSNATSNESSPIRSLAIEGCENGSPEVLVFSIYNCDEHKLQPLTEEEVLKMNSIGQEIESGDLMVVGAESCNLDNTIDKSSSMANGFDGIDDRMSDVVLRPLHAKSTARFSLSHDDASIGNSDNLEVVSEVPSNHSVTSSLELEEEENNGGDRNDDDNLSDMVSANVSGRGTPNISGRDTPSSQVTDGESVNNALPTPQMQKLISKARSDIQDKFCKFEIKKFEGDETVSIISDTWSTDVLASDSETLDASERERERDRDRNFSTPLIPSAVVLPGDNNFDVLARVGATGAVRPGYLDVSDQRSESNWSTDVLASDSEKLAEVDTDDNLSITAKSDTTDAGIRVDQERDMLAAAISSPAGPEVPSQRTSDYYLKRGGRGFRVAASPGFGAPEVGGANGNRRGGSGSSGGNASDRSQEDSAFYDAVNIYDDAALSSLARSSVRTTNQLSGENSFQQEYKSGNSNENKEPFLATPRMRRQISAESSISNQSFHLEEVASDGKPAKAHHKGAIKKKKHNNNNNSCKDNDTTPTRGINNNNNNNNDLIDFSEFGAEKNALVVARMNGGESDTPPILNLLSDTDGGVEHRRFSMERSTVFDGRRNGIMAMMSGLTGDGEDNEDERQASSGMPALRRHQSLNYENHEIMISATIQKHLSLVPQSFKSAAQTDDDKTEQQQLMLLCAKTEELQLCTASNNDGNNSKLLSATDRTTCPIALTSPDGSAVVVPSAGTTTAAATAISAKSAKSTGAIPKSISFDASADKSGAIRNNGSITALRTVASHREALRHGANSGIFTKLKQGIFKHRRNNNNNNPSHGNANKAHRHSNAPITHAEDFSTSSRSVSFSTNASEMSLEIMGTSCGGRGGGGPGCSVAPNGSVAGYCDLAEDILAKYRRKVSTSSEATTNSDSTTGHSGRANRNKSATEATAASENININRSSATPHDKAVAFNMIKKKIRTVLSKTDLHTGDFRHTTQDTNASPLLTYLQIQLAQAINLQNFQQVTYVSEALRCIGSLELAQQTQLLAELQLDIQKRRNYLQYLMRYRQNLLVMMENIDQFETRLRSESATCNRYLMAICVRLFIEKRQTKIEQFQAEFARLTMSDDKVDLIEELIDAFMAELLGSGGTLHDMPEWQSLEARISIERILLQRMYQQVMFPNEDADLSRDIVLSEHIRKLQAIIRPSHPALCIPQQYLSEAPWTFSQQQLSYISAYKTPREKLQCVIRCISSIMSLLHMSSEHVPAADDLLPVLIYVVVMANPPYLLSTVDFITCFIGEKLDGEEQFHWTLFCSVVKFIKTMDYLE